MKKSNHSSLRRFFVCFPLLLTLFMMCSEDALSQIDYSNDTVKNTNGGAMSLLDITNGDGQVVAKLYIFGKEANFGDNQVLLSPGYIKAEPNEYVHVVVTIMPSARHEKDLGATQIELAFKRINFGQGGKVTSAYGLDPKIDRMAGNTLYAIPSAKSIAINGFLLINLKGGHTLRLPLDSSCRCTISNADFLLPHI